jgi:predicted regulator of Ras-like GTPase activity (Roadblock/LC7/MglB family)
MKRALLLPENLFERIEKVLDELQTKTGSTYVFLADISGQMIHAQGRTGSTDVIALAALTASNMAATSAMARMIGEPERFRLLFHEGQRENIYLSHVGDSFVLAVVFDAKVQIGLVRLFSKRAVEELTNIANEFESAQDSSSLSDMDFGQALTTNWPPIAELEKSWRNNMLHRMLVLLGLAAIAGVSCAAPPTAAP